jgi:F-type H+-transporting ATPase subunit gamma
MYKKTRLRDDLEFNKLMGSIIEVLRGVAVAEYFSLQSRIKSFDEFRKNLDDLFQMVNVAGFQHPFLGMPGYPNNFVLITSDTGFLGELNVSVVKTAVGQCRSGDEFTVIGKQGARYIGEHGLEHNFFPGIGDEISYNEVIKLRDHIVNEFLTKKLGGTVIVYPHFISFAMQKVQTFQILPCRFLFPEDTNRKPLLSKDPRVLVEPSVKKVITYLVKIWIGQLLYTVFWESKLSELAARVRHLEKSTNEIKDRSRKMKFQYFRLLRQISDKNIREIFASRLALEKNR